MHLHLYVNTFSLCSRRGISARRQNHFYNAHGCIDNFILIPPKIGVKKKLPISLKICPENQQDFRIHLFLYYSAAFCYDNFTGIHNMKIDEICSLLAAEIHSGIGDPDIEIERAFASDLMSDVLTLMTDHLLLITGLNNIQTVRTAEMSDIGHILIVRGKIPTLKMIELADELGIVLMSTRYSMFKASGILYTDGLEAVF